MKEENPVGEKFYPNPKSTMALIYALNLPFLAALAMLVLVYGIPSITHSKELFAVFILLATGWGFALLFSVFAYLAMKRTTYVLGEESFIWKFHLFFSFEERYKFCNTTGFVLSQGPLQRMCKTWSIRITSAISPEEKTNLILRRVPQDEQWLKKILSTIHIDLDEKPFLEKKSQFSTRRFLQSYPRLAFLFSLAIVGQMLSFLPPVNETIFPFIASGLSFLYVLCVAVYLLSLITLSFSWNAIILLPLLAIVGEAQKIEAGVVMFCIVLVPTLLLYIYSRKNHQSNSISLYSNHFRCYRGVLVGKMSFVPYDSIRDVQITPIGSQGVGHVSLQFLGGYLMGKHGEYTVPNRAKAGYLSDIKNVMNALEKQR